MLLVTMLVHLLEKRWVDALEMHLARMSDREMVHLWGHTSGRKLGKTSGHQLDIG